MKVEIRHARREELPEILALVNAVFRPQDQTMGTQFSHVYTPENVENSVVALDGGRLLSHFGVIH